MERKCFYNEDDRHYLQMMQGIIARMASNSANCKTWIVTLVAASITAGIAVQALSHWLFISVVPIIVFWQLDVYYLKLERGFRNRQRLFLNTVNAAEFKEAEYRKALYDFKVFECAIDDKEQGYKSTVSLDWTESVCPFYPVLLGIAVIVSTILLIAR